MSDKNPLIQDVSDTSLWVAYYRAKESKRPDALFNDPLAEILIGERGKQIAEDMNHVSRNSEWSVIMRTVIIDEYIRKLVSEGVDTILNLGAGMDTRPYRMNLPPSLKWIEVDYPNIIAHKNNVLKNEKPTCELSRVALDLANDEKRKAFFQQRSLQSEKIAVLTEGVIVYLTEAQVSDLAADLNSSSSFVYWIVEYLSPETYPYLKDAVRTKKMKNAPFQFFPADWIKFFTKRGWSPKEIHYQGELGLQRGRPMPLPTRAFIFKLLAPKAMLERTKRTSGYILLEQKGINE